MRQVRKEEGTLGCSAGSEVGNEGKTADSETKMREVG